MDAARSNGHYGLMTDQREGAGAPAVPKTVLLVEDNAMIAMNTEALLLDHGVETVHVASSVAQAFALIDAERFDFALLDLQLGDGENSIPIALRLVEHGTRIVFATGYGEAPLISDNLGAMPILKKPYSFEDLGRILNGADA